MLFPNLLILIRKLFPSFIRLVETPQYLSGTVVGTFHIRIAHSLFYDKLHASPSPITPVSIDISCDRYTAV